MGKICYNVLQLSQAPLHIQTLFPIMTALTCSHYYSTSNREPVRAHIQYIIIYIGIQGTCLFGCLSQIPDVFVLWLCYDFIMYPLSINGGVLGLDLASCVHGSVSSAPDLLSLPVLLNYELLLLYLCAK